MRTTAPSARAADGPWHGSFAADAPAETAALAARLAAALDTGDVVALWGDLGAGKTTFARGLIAALAAEAGEAVPEVPSPTFTLVQTYAFPRFTVWHFDLYRIERPDDAWELGLEEALADGVSLIEWPERLGPLLPAARIDVSLGFVPPDEKRHIEVTAAPGLAPRIAAALA
ncbi:MAG: tRNA (adenosine(37)-N6)-threonylcarbamoyltransferase complex ATPase subunit type 1 TsaE [Rhodospirillaceae bacterium]|nr:tRNA (adenosine(37)-N6)-threonylcarbamoyltransferase complex ATPase subunit type 1 TsaE [Rhodospirillaceae bacterium]